MTTVMDTGTIVCEEGFVDYTLFETLHRCVLTFNGIRQVWLNDEKAILWFISYLKKDRNDAGECVKIRSFLRESYVMLQITAPHYNISLRLNEEQVAQLLEVLQRGIGEEEA